MRMNLYKQTTTYYPTLIPLLQKTTGTVLELGTGISSTPLLHWMCLDRMVISYENNMDYYREARKYKSRNHRIRFTQDFTDIEIRPYSVVLIDHSPPNKRRGEQALLLKDSDFLVLHDSEDPKYGYEDIYEHFKYRYDWKRIEPYTTVLSNKHRIEEWI